MVKPQIDRQQRLYNHLAKLDEERLVQLEFECFRISVMAGTGTDAVTEVARAILKAIRMKRMFSL